MLKNKIIVVTGGAGLLGKEFVKSIYLQNGIPIIAEIDEDNGINTKNVLNSEFNTDIIDFHPVNIVQKESVLDLINYIDNKYGRIDAVINNAYPRNKNYGRHFFDVEYEDFSENISLNLGGYFLVSQHFAKYFLKQGNGNIINISSIYGVVSPRFEIYKGTDMTAPVEYAAIKSGLIHLTKYMAKYFKGKNIRVNCMSLGGIYDHQPNCFLNNYKSFCLNKGILNPDDVIGSLIFLLSDLSTFVNGHNLVVDDGFTL